MTLTRDILDTEDVVVVGTKVRLYNGAEGVIEGVGTVYRSVDGDPSETVVVYEVEVTKDHVGAGDVVTLEGTRMLLYRTAFTPAGKYLVKLTANIRTTVDADDEVQAIEAVRTALTDSLMWDGDENAPQALEELELRISDEKAEGV